MTLRTVLFGTLAGVIALGALTSPVRADDRDHRREEREHHERHWDRWDRDRPAPVYGYAYGYAPPPVVYAPPPPVVASPGLNLMFNFR